MGQMELLYSMNLYSVIETLKVDHKSDLKPFKILSKFCWEL